MGRIMDARPPSRARFAASAWMEDRAASFQSYWGGWLGQEDFWRTLCMVVEQEERRTTIQRVIG